MNRLLLKSTTSGRFYQLRLKNNGRLYLSRLIDGVTNDDLTLIKDRCLVNTARSAAFAFGIKDTDLANPLVSLVQVDNIHLGRAYFLLDSPNGSEWEVTCTQDGVYKIQKLSVDWPRAQTPILSDPSGLAWRFEVDDGGTLQVVSDPAELHRRDVKLLSQDGTMAFTVSVDTAGTLTVSDIPIEQARYYDAELVSPNGIRWVLRVDQNGVLFTDSEWEDATHRPDDEWTVLIAERTNQLYVVDARVPPPGSPGAARYAGGW
jgi:predicted secreted protein